MSDAKHGLSSKEKAEYERLRLLWATQQANPRQMMRCMQLGDRAARATGDSDEQ